MSHDHSHQDLLQGLLTQLRPILESSKQGMYVYLDDEQKACNEKFAELLGYGSAEEWAGMEGSFPPLFVDAGSQHELIDAYQQAMQDKAASTITVRWKKKSGGTVDTTVILVPIAYEGHLFALHFVE